MSQVDPKSLRERVAGVLVSTDESDVTMRESVLLTDALISARMVCTPEEREVLEAAKEWRHALPGGICSALSALAKAVDAAYPPAPPKPRRYVAAGNYGTYKVYDTTRPGAVRPGSWVASFDSQADAESYAAQKNAEAK